MFVLNPLPPALDAGLLARMAQAEPATIGHFRDWGFMDPEIRALQPAVRVAGTAVTLQQPGPDGTILPYALGQVRPGDILVIDRCGDRRHASFGGVIAYAAKVAGVAGIIVDGLVTDIGELRRYGVPVWARGLCAITTRRIGKAGSFCIPVSCGGATVRPGDAIIADECGIVVLDPPEAATVTERALAMQAAEPATRARLDAGEKMSAIMGTMEVIERAATDNPG
jgi:regulator of RNase E activity RraA